MGKGVTKDFNSQHVVDGYDHHIRKLIPGYELVHQHIQAILTSHLSEHQHVLIIGCGTGYELQYLLKSFPHWTFTVTELSANMLEKARQHVEQLQQSHRVHFILGSHTDFEQEPQFDAVLSILVTHFVPYRSKQNFLDQVFSILNPNGIFISFDLMALQSGFERQVLPKLCEINGLTSFQATKMMDGMAEDFATVTEFAYLQMLKKSGFKDIQSFLHILSYYGYWAFKP